MNAEVKTTDFPTHRSSLRLTSGDKGATENCGAN